MARVVKQFYLHAIFEPTAPRREEAFDRARIREVLRRSARRGSSVMERVPFPGFNGLHELSETYPEWLKEFGGGAWQSYFQRGHWRMVFPFSRSHQDREAHRLEEAIARGEVAVVHVVRFPQLTINHALVVYQAESGATEVRFGVYDPNSPAEPAVLLFDVARRRFFLPENRYFLGGRVDVYEVFSGFCY